MPTFIPGVGHVATARTRSVWRGGGDNRTRPRRISVARRRERQRGLWRHADARGWRGRLEMGGNEKAGKQAGSAQCSGCGVFATNIGAGASVSATHSRASLSLLATSETATAAPLATSTTAATQTASQQGGHRTANAPPCNGGA
jgi:hypothetical protein